MATSHLCNGRWRPGPVAECGKHSQLSKRQPSVYRGVGDPGGRSPRPPPKSKGSSSSGSGGPSEEPDDPPELDPLELLEPLGFAGGFGDRPPGSPTPR